MINELNFFQYTSLLTLSQRKSFILFLVLSFIAMTLELLGIGLIFNLLQIITSDDLENIFFLNFFQIENLNKNKLFIIVMIGVLLIFSLKNIFLIFFEFKKFNFLLDIKTSLAKRLFSIYLFKPYLFHINNNSSVLIRNINDISLIIVTLRSLITFLIELTISLGLIIFLIYIEFIGSISTIIIIGLFALFFFKRIQKLALALGQERQFYDAKKYQHLMQGFSSIKDIKILQKEDFFIKSFTSNNNKTASAEAKHSFFLSLPKITLEWLIVFGMFVLTVAVFSQNNNFSTIIPILGVFAAAAFRIMPSLTRIMNAIQDLKYSLPAVKTLYNEVNSNKKTQIENLKFKNLDFKNEINLKKISYTYEVPEKNVFNNLNFKINYGDKVGIIGESGAGKTTLINIILGLLEPSEGEILIDGKSLIHYTREWQKKIGYVPQNIYLSDDTIKNNIAYGHETENINQKEIFEILNKTQLKDLISSLPNGIDTKVGELGDRLSGGERQRVGIARALYNKPSIIILDEFTSSLDINTEEKIMNEIDIFDKTKTIIIVSHRMSTLKKCNKIFQISQEGIRQIT